MHAGRQTSSYKIILTRKSDVFIRLYLSALHVKTCTCGEKKMMAARFQLDVVDFVSIDLESNWNLAEISVQRCSFWNRLRFYVCRMYGVSGVFSIFIRGVFSLYNSDKKIGIYYIDTKFII